MALFSGSAQRTARLHSEDNRLAIVQPRLNSVCRVFELTGVHCYGNTFTFGGTARRSRIITISELAGVEPTSFYCMTCGVIRCQISQR